jgi:pilus assembly protein CpaF
MKGDIHQELVNRYAGQLDLSDRHEVRSTIASLVDEFIRSEERAISPREREQLIDSLLDDVLGLGPLEILLRDSGINEVMINNYRTVYIELASGQIVKSRVVFESERQLRQVIDRIVSRMGRRVDESQPMVDARLPDGSRVNVVLPPVVTKGATMSIRKFVHQRMSVDDMIRVKAATKPMMDYLAAAVSTRLTIIVSGGTSSGKTTLLNSISSFIPAEERIVTIEEAAELQLGQENVIGMESRPPNMEGQGAIEIRELVRNALRMRPDRVIVGETRGPEALDMLQAMNTGHEGSLSTIHANSAEDVVSRIETLVLMSGTELPQKAIQKQISSAIDVIVQTERVRGGARRIVSIVELMGIDTQTGDIRMQEVFTYRQVGVAENGASRGYHTATGVKSRFLEHFRTRGMEVNESIFEPSPEPPWEELY